MPPSDWPIGKSEGCFLVKWLMWEGPTLYGQQHGWEDSPEGSTKASQMWAGEHTSEYFSSMASVSILALAFLSDHLLRGTVCQVKPSLTLVALLMMFITATEKQRKANPSYSEEYSQRERQTIMPLLEHTDIQVKKYKKLYRELSGTAQTSGDLNDSHWISLIILPLIWALIRLGAIWRRRGWWKNTIRIQSI